jgi:hypothetical protein
MLVIAISASVTYLISSYNNELRALQGANKTLIGFIPTNQYARYLGEEVLAKVYEASDWERCVIVAISWHGSVCVRPANDLATNGRWIHHAFARGRIKGVED